MTNRPFTEDDVRHFATYVVGHPDADTTGPPLAAARAVLTALAEEGRLVPCGFELVEHWGVRLRDGHTADYRVREIPARRLAASSEGDSLLHRYVTLWRTAEATPDA